MMGTGLSKALTEIATDLLDFFSRVSLPGSIVAAAIIIGWIWINSQRQEVAERLKASIAPWTQWAGTFVAIALTVMVSCRILDSVNDIFEARSQAELSQSSQGRIAQDVGPLYQSGPTIVNRVQKSYSRTLRLPSDVFDQIGQYGTSILAPYLGDPSADNVKELKDEFKRSGNELFVTRTVVRDDEEPLPFESATVTIRANRLPGSKPAVRAFNMDFDATYTFKNNQSQTQRMRFTFPQPDQQGPLSDFSLTVGNEKVIEPDENGWLVWEGDVPGGQELDARVAYRTQGSRKLVYGLASDRRLIRDFKLSFISNMTYKVTEGASLPQGGTGSTKTWQLQNVLSASSLGISFPANDGTGFLVAKVLGFSPIMIVVLAGILLYQRLPLATILGVLLFQSLGFAVIPALTPYMSLLVAALLGVGIAILLSARILKSKIIPLPIIVLAMPMAFLTWIHGGVIFAGAFTLVAALIASDLRKSPNTETVA